MSSKLNLGKFLRNCVFLGCTRRCSTSDWQDLQKFTSKLASFETFGAHFPVGKIIYWVVSFGQWAG